jgi:hypothetical protein
MKFIQNLFFALVFTFLPYISFAQCAMCKASAEHSTIAKSLNQGILYLLLFPILVIGGGGYLWYKNRKKFAASDWEENS